ncbi:MAG: endonuclease domain-containing protein [Mycobacterium sp.]
MIVEPFRGRQAVRDGVLSRYRLQTDYRAVYRDVYIANETTMTAALRARAAWLWAQREATLVGISAAAVHRTKFLSADGPAELVRANRHGPVGIVVRSFELAPDEVCLVNRMSVTTPARTAFDIGRLLPEPKAVPIVDALLRATRISTGDVTVIADRRPGVRGVRLFRSTIELCDGGAESPQESRLRVLLVKRGLPKPETQIKFYDEYGEPYIRLDMGWRRWKVAVEYDGEQHWEDSRQRSWDIDRIELLEQLGWIVVRVSAAMMARPDRIVARVVERLRDRGCPL